MPDAIAIDRAALDRLLSFAPDHLRQRALSGDPGAIARALDEAGDAGRIQDAADDLVAELALAHEAASNGDAEAASDAASGIHGALRDLCRALGRRTLPPSVLLDAARYDIGAVGDSDDSDTSNK
jgi:hypothetical protein